MFIINGNNEILSDSDIVEAYLDEILGLVNDSNFDQF